MGKTRAVRATRWIATLGVALLLCAAHVASARAQDDSEQKGQWFLGGYYRHNWIPSYMLSPFLTRAPSVTNDGFGLTISHRTASGFTVQVGAGYMPYFVNGAFTAKDTLDVDTEYGHSDLALLHLTGALLWPIEFNRMLALEFGFGLDFGIITGNFTRSEAYPDAAGHYHPCQGAHMPVVTGHDKASDGTLIEYCDSPAANGRPVNAQGSALNPNGTLLATNTANEKGEQYGVRESRIPPVMAFPMLPLLALRFSPHEQIAIKFEFAFGIAQIWMGASLHVGFGTGKHAPEKEVEPDVSEPKPAAEPVASGVQGRVLGKVAAQGTDQPIGGAAIKTKRALSVLQTDERGLFIVDHINPGVIRFEVSHPDYESGTCETTIPNDGGDISLQCTLVPKPNEGAISGQVNDENGAAVPGARIEMMGPIGKTISSDHDGLFALPDAPSGAYRVRIDADGYLMQLVEVDVAPRETALPKIILIKKPATSLVTRKAQEIYIKQQINFETNKAEIAAGNDGLLREIADVILRNDDIQLLEIQGHTDNKGGREHNQELSQARAESVRSWLVLAGVSANRLVAKGYGQDSPLRPNSTPADRAKNRRVQFIILQQTR